jgi:Tol biopolymer transport system component/DNA-binding winged helix-turn-helix (wHTH) protein
VLESAPYPAFRLFSAQCSLRAVLEVLSARSQNSLKVLTRIRERAMSDELGQRRGPKDIRDSSSAANQTPSQETLRLCESGPFHLDPAERKLLRGNEMVVLTPKAFDTLVLLVRNCGRLLGKDELLAMLWPDSFVEEGSLSNNIFLLRKALGEDPAFIETVPRRGYRFIGAVRQFPRAAPTLLEKPPEVGAPGDSYPRLAASPTERPSNRIPRIWAGAVAAVGIIVTASILVPIIRVPAAPRVLRYVQLTNDGVAKCVIDCYPPAQVSDGSRVYFVEAPPRQSVVAQTAVNGGTVVRLPATFGGAHYVAVSDISPDRSQLLITAWNGPSSEAPLWVLNLSDGFARRLGDLMVWDATWSPDGKTIVYSKGQDLFVAKSDGSGSRRLVALPGLLVSNPRWSPDARVLRFTATKNQLDSLWEVSAAGDNLRPLFDTREAPRGNDIASECCGAWTPDGKYFVYNSTYNGVTTINAVRESHGPFRRIRSEPVQLTAGPMNFLGPSPSVDGKRLFVIGEQSRGELMCYDPDSRQFVTFLSGISAGDLDFSRDGKWVVYVTFPEGVIWRSRVDGSERLQLTNLPMKASLPRWSPDGKRIVFSSSTPGNAWKISLISADGGTPEQLIPGENWELDPNWSPDGESLVFGELGASPTSSIYVLNLQTRQVSTLPGSKGLFSPRWSPDGRFINANTYNSLKLLLFDLTTQTWSELDGGHEYNYPTWSRDAKYLYFSDPLENGIPFYRLRVADRRLERVANANFPRGVPWGLFGQWTGLTPDESPLLMRDTGMQEIYSLDVVWP